MDRDIALSLVEKMTVLNTALTKLSQYTLPADATREAKMLLMKEEPEAEPVTEPAEEPEPVPETTTRKKSTSK